MKTKLVILLSIVLLAACSGNNWRTASREPAGIAADPKTFKDAVIEFYTADANTNSMEYLFYSVGVETHLDKANVCRSSGPKSKTFNTV